MVEKNNMHEILLAGVIGDPINHSRSPLIHNYWIKKNRLNHFYIPLKVPVQDLKKQTFVLRDLGFSGFNVTIPHKVAILDLVDDISPEAKKIGAANTIKFHGNKVLADNTDAYGFKNAILKNFPHYNFKKQNVLVIGSGGSSRAVLSVFVDEKVSSIRIINRTQQKARQLASDFSPDIECFDWSDMNIALDGVSTVVNTTSLGNLGNKPFNHSLAKMNKSGVAIDLVYNPVETSFMRMARKAGLKTINGLDMLIYQAVPGFNQWFKKKPNYSNELREMLEESLKLV